MPEQIRLQFQLILYLVTTGVFNQLLPREMHWFQCIDLKILGFKNKIVHFSGFL